MPDKPVQVTAYSGYRGEESPRSFMVGGKRVEVRKILARWIEEDEATAERSRWFRVKGDDFRVRVLRCRERDGIWFMEEDGEK
ncbi:MAG TPA: hypothetical protein VMJ66_09110 [Geobacteraceae bacterium]|nr:hypothetical protein [Geobacteraceae bacterium]